MEIFITISEIFGGIFILFGLGYLIGILLKLDKFFKK